MEPFSNSPGRKFLFFEISLIPVNKSKSMFCTYSCKKFHFEESYRIHTTKKGRHIEILTNLCMQDLECK